MKHFIIACILLQTSAMLYSQAFTLSSINSELYIDLERWEEAGYMETLPIIQPYSNLEIKTRIIKMLGNNDLPLSIRQRAEKYLSLLEPTELKPLIGTASQFRASENAVNLNLNFYPGLRWQLEKTDTSSVWAEFLVWIYFSNYQIKSYNPSLPSGQREIRDALVNTETIIELPGLPVYFDFYLQNMLSFSYLTSQNGIVSFRAGVHRTNVGPFWDDGLVFSPQTTAAGHFALSYEHIFEESDNFNTRLYYSSQLSILGLSDNQGKQSAGNKFSIHHSLHVDFEPWLGFGYFETVIWGGNLELIHLIPLTSFVINEGITGHRNNTLVGFELLFRPVSQLKIPIVLYIDDIGASALYRLDFNTSYKLAFQTGITWSPLLPWIDQLEANYTAVLPYMYTHRPPSAGGVTLESPNTTNYTHNGVNIGPGLEPNSDRWRLNWRAQPLVEFTTAEEWFEEFSLLFGVQLIRHANASADINNLLPANSDDKICTPKSSSECIDGRGDIFDPGYTDDGRATYTPNQKNYTIPNGLAYTRFLTQSIIEHTLQFTIGLKSAFQVSPEFYISAELSYTHEEIWNYNLVEGARNSGNYFSLLLGLTN